MSEKTKIGITLGIGFFALALIFVFQQVTMGDFLSSVIGWESHGYASFVVNKATRLLANDVVCFAMIYVIFPEREYRQLGLWIFLLELLIVLPLYLFLKLTLEGDSEISTPLLSFVHRLIVNPMLMILTMGALGYQKYIFKQ